MPIVQPGSSILVTGATGFVAAWIIHTLLKRGFHVRGAVRSEAKGKDLEAIFGEFGNKFEFVVVEDMQKEGAYDRAVKDIDAVAHVASPMIVTADDPQELILPAVNGTTGILSSITQHGSAVKRVVLTSSAVTLPFSPSSSEVPQIITENDWNETSPKLIEKLGRAASGSDKYRASKVLAERAAWEFIEKHTELKWDLVTLIPPWVFGPIMHKVTSPTGLGFSCGSVYKLITDEDSLPAAAFSQPFDGSAHYVDVRDLAQAHVDSLVKEEAGNQRLIVSAGVWTWQDFLDCLSASPLATSLSKLPKGIYGAGKSAIHTLTLDSSKAERILGVQFRTLEDTAIDSAKDFMQRGWLQ